jgi:3-hydroxybutyryl-CoA dehydrogenase
MEVERVAVIGAGTMGRGIVHAAALGGFRVTLQDVDSGVLEGALEGIQKEMQKAVERDRIDEGEMRGGLERISPTESLE